MDYARAHVKRYWGMAYRRMLGIAFITVSVSLAIGLTFTALTGNLAVTNVASYIVFWAILALGTLVILLTNFFHAHVSSVGYMNELEHRSHSKHMGLWMIVIVVGIVAFLSPVFLVNLYIEPVYLVFTVGGIFWMLYLSVNLIFKHSYGELAIGGAALWIMFFLGILEISGSAFSNSTIAYFSTYFAAMVITVVVGFTGLALIYNYSNESMREFRNVIEKLERESRGGAPQRRRRRR